MHCDEVLDKLLQLVPVHLEKCLWDGQAQFDLLRPPYSVQWQCHNMGTVKDVFVATATCHCCDFTAVKADAYIADHFWLRGCGRFPHCSTEMKPYKKTKHKITVSRFKLTGSLNTQLYIKEGSDEREKGESGQPVKWNQTFISFSFPFQNNSGAYLTLNTPLPPSKLTRSFDQQQKNLLL